MIILVIASGFFCGKNSDLDLSYHQGKNHAPCCDAQIIDSAYFLGPEALCADRPLMPEFFFESGGERPF
ncbi:hypothetical protein [uncultured Martelella sp.]|uniref:hypothetical protein n=1 Tax=uncultured Martelella sp. TaxID=392331 RepID=UPI0029C81A24|nr:hypothetical protein [uncultured Martelella sp.]